MTTLEDKHCYAKRLQGVGEQYVSLEALEFSLNIGYKYTYIMKAYKLYHEKNIHENGAIEERIVWLVPKSQKNPEGVKYRFVYILKQGEKPAVCYDNHHPKGHHKHIRENEIPYCFKNVEQLIEDFEKDIKEVLKS